VCGHYVLGFSDSELISNLSKKQLGRLYKLNKYCNDYNVG
jgi:hypothetical protein